MDATHNTNRLHWKLFTVMIRDEYGNWIPGVHILRQPPYAHNRAKLA